MQVEQDLLDLRAKHTLYILSLVVQSWIFYAPIGLCGESSDTQSLEERIGWRQLDLEVTNIKGTTVFYEKSLEPNLPILEDSLNQLLAGLHTFRKIRSHKEQILQDINHIIGIDRPHPGQIEILASVFGSDPASDATFYFVSVSTIKDFLKKGGQLPDCRYDPATDYVTYNPVFVNVHELKKLELAIPFKSGENGNETLSTVFFDLLHDTVIKGLAALAIHEAAELGLILRLKTTDRYCRWFTDGFADAIAYELLEKYADPQSAQIFLKQRDIDSHKDIIRQINLRYWMSAQFYPLRNSSPIDNEEKLSKARYAYAMHEAKRLIDKHAIDCIGKILDNVSTAETRNSEMLIQTINNTLGEDIDQRLRQYQDFETREHGIIKYRRRFGAVSKVKDYEQMISNVLRLLELQESVFSKDVLVQYNLIAVLLNKMGFEAFGDLAMKNCYELFQQCPEPWTNRAAVESVLIYALGCKRPQIAEDLARKVLTAKPDHTLSLTVIMQVQASSGHLDEAIQTATKIMELGDHESFTYKTASAFLAQHNNSQAKTLDR